MAWNSDDLKYAVVVGIGSALCYLGIMWYLRRFELAEIPDAPYEEGFSPNGRLKAVEEDVPSSAE